VSRTTCVSSNALKRHKRCGRPGTYVEQPPSGAVATARDNLIIAERMFAVVDASVRNGAASILDSSRQQAVLGQRTAFPPFELQERQTLVAPADAARLGAGGIQ
jgi:hypothetical protein